MNYKEYTDKYFLRTKQILEAEGINPIVRYQVFARQDIDHFTGINEAVAFIKGVAGNKVRVFSLKEGDPYVGGEPIMKLEGRAQDLVDLETVYLGILSGNITGNIDMDEVRNRARAIVQAAQGKPVSYFGARHYHYSLDEEIGRICIEEGFQGASTDAGAKSAGLEGSGTTPHALFLIYQAYLIENEIKNNPSVEAMKAFDRNIDKSVPRVLLCDTFNRELIDSMWVAGEVPNLSGIRIDTCGENYAEGSQQITPPYVDVDNKYLFGRGVTITPVWFLRSTLNIHGFKNLTLTVSSGFNAEKTAAFVEADRVFKKEYGAPLFDYIGSGSVGKPIMTTSDIIAYQSDKSGLWIPLSKIGRYEKGSSRLEEVV